MNTSKKIGFIGSLASIIGLIFIFLPNEQLPEQNQRSRDNHNIISLHTSLKKLYNTAI